MQPLFSGVKSGVTLLLAALCVCAAQSLCTSSLFCNLQFWPHALNMANAAESQPFFEQHARKVGMEQQLLERFITGGVRTVSMAAYAATQPGQPLTDKEVSTLCTSLGQDNPTRAQLTVVKRLLFECRTMSLANLEATVGQQPDSVLRKLPGAERAQRLDLQAQRNWRKASQPRNLCWTLRGTASRFRINPLKWRPSWGQTWRLTERCKDGVWPTTSLAC